MSMRIFLFAVAVLFTWGSVFAGIEYVKAENRIQVTGYPKERPCTPADLVRADRIFGWNKVTYDPKIDTCKLDCGLTIGRNDCSSTYFQLGSTDHPCETLIVKGPLRVYSTWLKDENKDLAYHHIRGLKRNNRLTLGVPGHPEIKARFLIDNRDRKGYSITIGGTSGYGRDNGGGELHVYNSEIGPCGDVRIGEKKRRFTPVYMGGAHSVILDGAIIRGVTGRFARNLFAGKVTGTTFENCIGGYIGNFQKVINNSKFLNCKLGLNGSLRHDLFIYDCVFKGNAKNWSLTRRPLIAIDCKIDSFDKGVYSKNKKAAFVSKRHVIVKVTDSAGRPIRKAKVKFVPDSKPFYNSSDVNAAITGNDGLTPGKSKSGVLLLSEIMADSTGKTGYQYVLTAQKGNKTGTIKNLSITESWKTITIQIK